MHTLIIPDKFKGSLTATEVCNSVSKGILSVYPNSKITKLPLADGGEESLETLEATLNLSRIYLKVNNPLFIPTKAWYGIKNDTAYIEMAKASGLQLLEKGEQNPMDTTSYGTGELIIDAIKNGAKIIYLFVGGSATNDAGIGLASALGYSFLDGNNNVIEPIGSNLKHICKIENSCNIDFNEIVFYVLTDVTNTLFGENGAAFVFAAQKGASKKEIVELDEGLENFNFLTKKHFEKDFSNIAGSGAAGGIGAGVMCFCNAELKSGINEIIKLLNIEQKIEDADLVITGEGLFDHQTLQGKVVKGVMDLCKKKNKPLAILCGATNFTKDEINEFNPIIIKPIKTESISIEDSMGNAFNLLTERTIELLQSEQFN